MNPSRMAPVAACLLLVPVAVSAEPSVDPFTFFSGRTENHATVKVILKKPYKTHAVGQGRLERDGSLTLVQQVEEDGKPPRERRWRVRQLGPGRYMGTMSEAIGPVTIEKIGAGYRFKFKMKGNLAVEQWLTPLANGRAAKTAVKVKKMGVTVATTHGVIRKVGGS